MNSEQEKQLLDYLESLGFQSDELTSRIHKQQIKNLPSFNAQFVKMYGEERMVYNLNLKKDNQFNSYRLESYDAIHRAPVVIEHKQINGIDTARLEDRMKREDWKTYFENARELRPTTRAFMSESLDMLNQLSNGQNSDGIKIQEELMFKYWPDHVHESADKQGLKSLYEHGRKFIATESETCNANLAFHILSGRLDDLHEKLQLMGIDQFPGIDTYREAEKILSYDVDHFNVCSRNEPEGFIDYHIPVIKIDGWHYLDIYTATLTPYPPIEHGVYKGIDTKVLEEQMQKIDWLKEAQIHGEDGLGYSPAVEDILQKMKLLDHDLAGGDIADKLQIKYWTNTLIEDSISDSAIDLQSKLPKRENVFGVETDAKVAFNLLCGRAALEHVIYPYLPESDEWVRFNLDKRDNNGLYVQDRSTGFSKQELEQQLNAIPFSNSQYYGVRNGLIRGDLTPLQLNTGATILTEANPEQKTLNLYTADKRVIAANLNFDPDWRPQQSIQESAKKKQQTHHHIRPARINNVKKGKGL